MYNVVVLYRLAAKILMNILNIIFRLPYGVDFIANNQYTESKSNLIAIVSI